MGKIIIFLITLCSFVSASFLEIDYMKLNHIGKVFGYKALQRVEYVQKQLDTIAQEKFSYAQIYMVNSLINKISYKKDRLHWKNDYTSTLLEFVASGAGDSLDFAAAKYATLVNMGFDKDRFVFFKTDTQNMNDLKYDTKNYYVLGYTPKNSKEYVILDCYTDKITLAFRENMKLQPTDITLHEKKEMLQNISQMNFIQRDMFLEGGRQIVNINLDHHRW